MAKQALHQHDLRERSARRWIERCQLKKNQRVFEFGPGKGAITSAMLDAGAEVFAVEFDVDRCAHLRVRFEAEIENGQFTLVQGDALVHAPPWKEPWRLIANPPFQLNAALMRKILMGDWPQSGPHRADLVLQLEAIEKCCGTKKKSRQSHLCRLAGSASQHGRLDRNDVQPAARVSLAMLKLDLKNIISDFEEPMDDQVTRADLRLVDALLAQAFQGHHDMRSALKGLATSAIMKRQAKEQNWEIDAHPASLSSEAWLSLARYLGSIGRLAPSQI